MFGPMVLAVNCLIIRNLSLTLCANAGTALKIRNFAFQSKFAFNTLWRGRWTCAERQVLNLFGINSLILGWTRRCHSHLCPCQNNWTAEWGTRLWSSQINQTKPGHSHICQWQLQILQTSIGNCTADKCWRSDGSQWVAWKSGLSWRPFDYTEAMCSRMDGFGEEWEHTFWTFPSTLGFHVKASFWAILQWWCHLFRHSLPKQQRLIFNNLRSSEKAREFLSEHYFQME